MLPAFFRWWNAGEDHAIRVYRQGFKTLFAVTAVSAVFVPLILRLRITGLFGFPAFFIICALFQKRQAIVLGPNGIAYRPPFAKPRFVNFAEITSVQEAYTMSGMIAVKAFCIKLENGFVLRVPLTFPHYAEIRRELEKSLADHGIFVVPRKKFFQWED